MIERLLLDRIDAEPGRTAIGFEHDLVVLARAHEAQPALAFAQPAMARADVALHAPVREHLPVAGRNRVAHARSWAPGCDLQIGRLYHAATNPDHRDDDPQPRCCGHIL